MSHMHINGGLPQYREAVMATGSDPYGQRDTEADNPLRDHIRITRRRRSSIDSLTQAQRLSEKEVPDIYSQSDAGVVRGWNDRGRPRISQQHVHPGTLPARPHDRFAGSPGLLRPPFMDVLAVDSSSQPPECHVCYEAFTDEEPRLVPRNLQCGHSFCTGEWLVL